MHDHWIFYLLDELNVEESVDYLILKGERNKNYMLSGCRRQWDMFINLKYL